MAKLILLRHGQSTWNKKNIFTGWVDVSLSQEGIQEALQAGILLNEMTIDRIFVSKLIRASMTAMLALSNHPSKKVPAICHEGPWYAFPKDSDLIPVIEAEELNERMYGELQGKNKQQIKEKFGEQQFTLWRRSYDVPPPHGESLSMTAQRALPYFHRHIVPCVQRGETALVSAHGNSLRAMIMELEGLDHQQVVSLEIPTGKPIVYEYSKGKFVR
ncbi:MAG: histidine phosphatase family protein [Verrucomicrobia bacterium]|nr:histidine phosphatase family protein [Verrucomicrobiota bacterium]MBS0645380.1 histidine phosphatase family protein [Verrucomicrobiota bacterium]